MCVQCVLRYTITWLQCAFSLVVDRDLLKDTHTDGFKSTSAVLFFFFHAPKTFNLTGDQKVAGSIPIWGSETFFWVCDKAWVYSKQFSFNLPSCKSTSYVYIYITFILLFCSFHADVICNYYSGQSRTEKRNLFVTNKVFTNWQIGSSYWILLEGWTILNDWPAVAYEQLLDTCIFNLPLPCRLTTQIQYFFNFCSQGFYVFLNATDKFSKVAMVTLYHFNSNWYFFLFQ